MDNNPNNPNNNAPPPPPLPPPPPMMMENNNQNNINIPNHQEPNININNGGIGAAGIQKLLRIGSNVGNFLPTGTTLMYEALIPIIYDNGEGGHCLPNNKVFLILVLFILSASCFFLSFVDSEEQWQPGQGERKTVLYGFVNPSGLWVPGHGTVRNDRYRRGYGDYFYAFWSVIVFLMVALSDYRVINCLIPDGKKVAMERWMKGVTLGVGVVISALYYVFPVHRNGLVPTPAR